MRRRRIAFGGSGTDHFTVDGKAFDHHRVDLEVRDIANDQTTDHPLRSVWGLRPK